MNDSLKGENYWSSFKTKSLLFDKYLVWFHHDSSSAHNAVRQYLNELFTVRIISSTGTNKWPARSPGA